MIPAGIEIKCRITGSNRAKKIPPPSYRCMNRSARSTFAGGMKQYLPNRITSGRPTNSAVQYVIAAPNHDPKVPAKITPGTVMRPPWAASIAAGGTTNSLGTGKTELSIAINSTTPPYPHS